MPNIEDQIRKAIQDGQFDNLTGKGQRLDLEDNPFVDPEWRMAHHMLKESGFSLPWIETRNEILSALENARDSLARAWGWRISMLAQGQPTVSIEAEWQRSLSAFNLLVQETNKKTHAHNLEVPSTYLQLPIINAEAEIAKITSQLQP